MPADAPLPPARGEGEPMDNGNYEMLLNAVPEIRAYIYRKILHADLVQDRCSVLVSDPEGWQPGDGSLTGQLADFARSGAIHPGDMDRFVAFTRLQQLRAAPQAGQEARTLIYRRQVPGGYRWNLMEVVPDQKTGEVQSAILCFKDVHDALREGFKLARSKRDMQMAAILKCRYQMMNTVYLDSGMCERVDLRQDYDPDKVLTGDYSLYIQTALARFVHPDDAEIFRSTLSLEHLRETAATIRDYGEEVCQYRLQGETLRWIELHVLYGRQGDQVMVNILGQDVTEDKLQEAAKLQALEDRAYLITSLSSLFFSTYYIDLEQDSFRAVTQQRRVGDVLGDEINFTAALRLYANHFIHPDDRERYLSAMDVERLRRELRWWTPYVAVEYRKLPEDPSAGAEAYSWTRATAVLARTGSDDMPKTAVYVARDITRELDDPASVPHHGPF